MNRVHIASIRNRPSWRAQATTSSASAAFIVNGFSHSTAFPARRHSSELSLWNGCGVDT